MAVAGKRVTKRVRVVGAKMGLLTGRRLRVANVNATLTAVEWVGARYSADVALGGISPLNEPIASGADLEALKGCYEKGYEAVRRHSEYAFVGIQMRVGDGSDGEELHGLEREHTFTNVVLGGVLFQSQCWGDWGRGVGGGSRWRGKRG